MGLERKETLAELLEERGVAIGALLSYVPTLRDYGVEYERAYRECRGAALHAVLVALGVPLEQLYPRVGIESRDTWLAMRERFSLHSLPVLRSATGHARSTLFDLARAVPGVLIVPDEEPGRTLLSFGTDYERAYTESDAALPVTLLALGASVSELTSWLSSRPVPDLETDDQLRTRFPIGDLLSRR